MVKVSLSGNTIYLRYKEGRIQDGCRSEEKSYTTS